MAAGKLDLVIEKGATFNKVLYYKDSNNIAVDLTGYDARLQVRKSANSATTVLDLTVGNGITLGTTDGKISISVSATDTSAILESGMCVYELELVDVGGSVLKLVRGTVSLVEEITR